MVVAVTMVVVAAVARGAYCRAYTAHTVDVAVAVAVAVVVAVDVAPVV